MVTPGVTSYLDSAIHTIGELDHGKCGVIHIDLATLRGSFSCWAKETTIGQRTLINKGLYNGVHRGELTYQQTRGINNVSTDITQRT
ncbi:hypothetical protein D3C87_1424390 [compost metagenome]